MLETHLYEYAVIRFVPKVEREEFLNVGIILFSKKAKYLKIRYHLEEYKLSTFASEADMECFYKNLESFEKICEGQKEGGFIATLDLAERFRWLTAIRSTCIQTSRPHSGLSDDMDKTLNRLLEELVL